MNNLTLIFDLSGKLGNHFFILSAMIYAIKKYNIKCYLYVMNCVNGGIYIDYVYEYLNDYIIDKIPENARYCYDICGDMHVGDEIDLDLVIQKHINDDVTIYLYWEWFQDKKYFLPYKEDIQKIFNVNDIKFNKWNDMITDNDVFISVRRGDYIYFNFFVLTDTFYIDIYNEYFEGKNIYMSSDDIEWCKTYLSIDKFNNCKNITYIENYTPQEIVSLSKYFSNYICANSTFSWMCNLNSIHNNKKGIGVINIKKDISRDNVFDDNDIVYDLRKQDNIKYIDTINDALS